MDWYAGNKSVRRNSPPAKQPRGLPDSDIPKERHASSCVDLVDSDEEEKFFKNSKGYEDSSSDEEESSSSEDDDQDCSKNEDKESDDSDTDDNATIGQIFREIEQGTFDANKRKKRFKGQRSMRKVSTSSSYLDEESREMATRGVGIMNTNRALYELTRNERDKWDDDDEWIIIKVPKKGGNGST